MCDPRRGMALYVSRELLRFGMERFPELTVWKPSGMKPSLRLWLRFFHLKSFQSSLNKTWPPPARLSADTCNREPPI